MSNQLRIVVDVEEELKFRRRALRRMPNEYMETLFGYVEGDTAFICAFVDIEHEGTENKLDYDEEDLERHKRLAAKSGLQLLGTIHTHPHRPDGMYSEGDARDTYDNGELIFGICAIDTSKERRKVVIQYWPGVKPLNVEYRKLEFSDEDLPKRSKKRKS